MTSVEEKTIEAQKCIDVAKQAMSDGDLKKAERFLRKSQTFMPSDKADSLLRKVEEELHGSKTGPQSDPNAQFSFEAHFRKTTATFTTQSGTETKKDSEKPASPRGSTDNTGPRQRHASQTSHQQPQQSGGNASNGSNSTGETKRRGSRDGSNSSSASAAGAAGQNANAASSGDKPYTPEQQQAARAVKKMTDLYGILSITKTATDVEIKAAYRKMALKFHPDKNKAPESEEAFKKVTEAYSILSDPQEREHYDRNGTTREDYRRAAARQYANEAAAQREAPLTPEDIFNMFFEVHGGGRRHFRTHRAHFAAGPDRGGGGQAQGMQWMALVQFLPVILLFLFSFVNMTGGGSDDNPFSLDPTNQFSQRRTTPSGTVYFVSNNFNRQYGRDSRAISRVEAMVDQTFYKKLEDDCNMERKQQKVAISEAKKAKGPDQASLLSKAYAMSSPSCSKLDAIRVR